MRYLKTYETFFSPELLYIHRMRYLKTYETFFSNLFKKKSIENYTSIIDRYTVDDILYMFQEFNDDFNLNIDVNSVNSCHLVSSTSKKERNIWYKDFRDVYGRKWYLNMSGRTKHSHNCYIILLHVFDEDYKKINKKQLIEIIEHKKKQYNLDYIITNRTFGSNPQTGLPLGELQWRVFIF